MSNDEPACYQLFSIRWIRSSVLLVCMIAWTNLTQAVEPIAAFTPKARILFQGDSITDGNRGRSPDPNHILGHGYAFITAARHGAGFPSRDLNFMNRGVSGNTVLDLKGRWEADTLELKPDILSIMIGVNDDHQNVPIERFEQAYEEIIQQAKDANPKLKLVLIEPFWNPKNELTQKRKDRQSVVVRLAKKYDAALVQCQEKFERVQRYTNEDYWIWDDVHPTYRGHQLIADLWEEAVRNHWK